MKKNIFLPCLIAVAFLLGACSFSTPSYEIRAIKMDSKQFERRNCASLKERLTDLHGQEIELSQEQDKKMMGDGAAARQLAHVKGEINAISEALKKKGCQVQSVAPAEEVVVTTENSKSDKKTDVVTVPSKKDVANEKTGSVKQSARKVAEKAQRKDTPKEGVKVQKTEEAQGLTSKEKTAYDIEGWRIKSVETVPLTDQKEVQKVGAQKEKEVCPLQGKLSDKEKQACLLDGRSPNQKGIDKKDKLKKEETKKAIDKKDASQEIKDDPALLKPDQKVEEKVEKKIVPPIEKKEIIQKTKDSTEKTATDKPKEPAILEAFKAKQKKTEATKELKEAKETPLKVTEKVEKKEKPKVKKKAKTTNNFYRGRFGRYN